MKKSLFSFAALAMLVSCTNEAVIEPEVTADIQMKKTIRHTIPVGEAMTKLQAYLATEQDNGTRADISRKVANVKAVACRGKQTRGSEGTETDTLLYIANFENEEGYAIMSADDRIGEDILAITESGNISDQDIVQGLDEVENESRPIFDGFPTTGPGFFTDEAFGDEVFINPNTIELYDPDRDDTLIGNYDISDTSYANAKSEGEVIVEMCVDYANSSIGGRPDPNPDPGIAPNPNKSEDCDNRYLHKTLLDTDVIITDSKMPMLTEFRGWAQEGVFNYLYPVRRKYVLFGPSKKASAGCFPMALAKILTYFEYPTDFRYGDYVINWSAIKEQSRIGFDNKGETPTGDGNVSAMYLFKRLSQELDCLFFYNGTFTWPREVSSFLRHNGYNSNESAHNYEYKFERVKTMLDDGRPVIIYGVPGGKFWNAHAWNIDGYKITQWKKTYVRHWVTNDVTDMSEILDTVVEYIPQSQKVHCDFGWQGKHNGYYVSGIFKLNSEGVEHTGNYDNDKTHFNKIVKIITYDKPVR